jgi:hypothetical protein
MFQGRPGTRLGFPCRSGGEPGLTSRSGLRLAELPNDSRELMFQAAQRHAFLEQALPGLTSRRSGTCLHTYTDGLFGVPSAPGLLVCRCWR